LEQKLQKRRGVDDDHAELRSSRTTAAAEVFKVMRFRP
jgi:hypothetical protein